MTNRTGPIRAVLVTTAVAITAACSASESIPATDDPSSIEIAAGPDDVVLQLGSYDVGENIDQFVSGPDLVIYGDGAVYRDTIRLAPDAPNRFQRGVLAERRVLDIVAAARELPDVVDGDDCAVDEFEAELRIEGRTWSACGLLDAADFGAFLDAVRLDVHSTDLTPWEPSALVQLDPVTTTCAVVASSTLPASQTAAVYPHATDEYPPGEFPCPRSTP